MFMVVLFIRHNSAKATAGMHETYARNTRHLIVSSSLAHSRGRILLYHKCVAVERLYALTCNMQHKHFFVWPPRGGKLKRFTCAHTHTHIMWSILFIWMLESNMSSD